MKFFIAVTFFIISVAAHAQVKILFDASKAQMAGNADWVIDADMHNIGTSGTGAMVTGLGSEANPQRYPTPLQSTVTSAAAETYWEGSLSSWGIALVKLGYEVETLPYNDSITYGNASHLQDLSNYKVFIVDEPNIRFTQAERNAIVRFVQNGGGLFMISDHTGSDRNNDGWDSPQIWNDIMTTNTIRNDPFGMSFDYVNISQTTSNFNTLPNDSILHGPQGNPSQIMYSNGTTITLNTADNATVTGIVYTTGSPHGNTNAMMGHSYYGSGRVAALGDSSPPDDGTGDPNDALYTGWSGEVNGDHARILMNATIWLAGGSNTSGIAVPLSSGVDFTIYPNPCNNTITISCSSLMGKECKIEIYNVLGEKMYNVQYPNFSSPAVTDLSPFKEGVYFITLITESESVTKKIIKLF